MATAIASRPMTAAEFFDFVHRTENWGRFFELERGEVVETPVAGRIRGFVAANVVGFVCDYAAERGRGYACSNNAGFIVENGPDTVRGPDVSYYDDGKDFDSMERQYSTAPPLFAVEIVPPADTPARTIRRPAEYIRRGVKLVWVIDPESRTVVVYRKGHEPIVLRESDELTGYEILRGFRCKVADLFVRPGGKQANRNGAKKKPRPKKRD